MIGLPKLTSRQVLIVLHDLLATVAAIVLTFYMRFEGPRLAEKLAGLEIMLPIFLVFAAAVYFIFGMHRNKWRFTSVPDIYNIFRVSTVLAVSLLALDYVLLSPNVYGTFFFGKITILLYWFLQMFFLGGSRVAYRYFHYARTLQRVRIADATPTLMLGRAADAEVLLRSIESGAVKKIWPVGILSPSRRPPRAVDPRHSGSGRHRRSRTGRRRFCHPRHAGHASGAGAVGAVARGAAGGDPD